MYNLILTAAGKYQRFRRFSYEIPKYLLPVKNRTMLHYVLKGFFSNRHAKVTFVGNKQDINFNGAVNAILSELCNNYQTLWVDDTSGQAETLIKATENMHGPFIVHNVDTILLDRYWPPVFPYNDCGVDVFKSSNRNYSYVDVDNKGFVSTIKEKTVISDKASSGCYLFKDSSFRDYFDESTLYISQIINKMIEHGRIVEAGRVYNEKDTIVMGTPEEYLMNMDSDKLTEER
jgi:NDP-sugar pyrophosphorylase family protein